MGFEVMFVVVIGVMVFEEVDWTWGMGVAVSDVEMGVAGADALGVMGWTGGMGVTGVGELGDVGAEAWEGGLAGLMGEGDEGELLWNAILDSYIFLDNII